MESTERIEQIVAPALADMGYEIVRLRAGGGARPVLQVMIDRADREALTVDDCAAASRTVSALLDMDDVSDGAYTLEVSSPGIDRPLVRLADFERFAGFEAKVEMAAPLDGRRRFRGRLLGTDGDGVRLEADGSDVTLPFEGIRSAKLVLSDELIAAAGKTA